MLAFALSQYTVLRFIVRDRYFKLVSRFQSLDGTLLLRIRLIWGVIFNKKIIFMKVTGLFRNQFLKSYPIWLLSITLSLILKELFRAYKHSQLPSRTHLWLLKALQTPIWNYLFKYLWLIEIVDFHLRGTNVH